MTKKKQRPRRSFTPEYKADVVKLVREGGRKISEVCRDLDLTETRVRAWVQQAQVDVVNVYLFHLLIIRGINSRIKEPVKSFVKYVKN